MDPVSSLLTFPSRTDEDFSGTPAPNAAGMPADWKQSIEGADLLSDCVLCPRSCHVDRLRGERGFCGETGVLRAARAALYFNEEPVISGRRGSGAVFFSGCSLGCVYCQNRQISRPLRLSGESASADARKRSHSRGEPEPSASEDEGAVSPLRHEPDLVEISTGRLVEIFFELQEKGACSINLITPEHFVPLLIPALRRAKEGGLSIPIVYNTGSYERVESVRALEGLVDVWLPDLKYVSSALSARHCAAPDYFSYASAAIAEMVRQCPEPVFSDGSHAIDFPDDADDPIMVRGVLVRHLALPGCAEDSRAVLRYLHETYGNRIFISLMNQYTPMQRTAGAGSGSRAGSQPDFSFSPDPDLCRPLSEEEYEALVDYAIEIGIENGFIQESGTVSPEYVPLFDGTGL